MCHCVGRAGLSTLWLALGPGPVHKQSPSPPPAPPAGAGTGDILVTRLAFHSSAVCKVSPGGATHSVPDHTPVGFRSSLASWLGGALGRGVQGPRAGGAMGQQELRSSLTIRAPNRRPHPSKGPGTRGRGGWHHPAARLCVLRRVRRCATPQAVALQAPPSTGFSRQEHWSELPFPPPGDLPHPGIELRSSASPALAGGFFTAEPSGRPQWMAMFGKVSDD